MGQFETSAFPPSPTRPHLPGNPVGTRHFEFQNTQQVLICISLHVFSISLTMKSCVRDSEDNKTIVNGLIVFHKDPSILHLRNLKMELLL